VVVGGGGSTTGGGRSKVVVVVVVGGGSTTGGGAADVVVVVEVTGVVVLGSLLGAEMVEAMVVADVRTVEDFLARTFLVGVVVVVVGAADVVVVAGTGGSGTGICPAVVVVFPSWLSEPVVRAGALMAPCCVATLPGSSR
jgi:hypothetical protein